MTVRHLVSRRYAVALIFALAVLEACASSGRVAPERLTPVKDRVTDEAIARDLAVIGTFEGRVHAASAGTGTARKYVATRALEYLALARDAYERNDRTTFADDALGWAQADLAALERDASTQTPTSVVPIPVAARTVAAELWGRADALRRDVDGIAASDELARAESQLIRAAHPFLNGPACIAESPLDRAKTLLASADRTRVAPDPVLQVPDRPPPVPVGGDSLPARPAACGGPDRLEGVPGMVHFALDRSLLSSATRAVLDRAVAALEPYPSVRIRLSGHTDPRASDSYNQALSERRVQAVRGYLSGAGIAAARLETEALGESRLLLDGRSVADHARNRRVEIRYILCDGREIPLLEQRNDLQLEAARRRQVQGAKD